MEFQDVSDKLRELISSAVELARKLSVDGRVIGRITRVQPVEVAEDKRVVSIEVSFKEYLDYSVGGGVLGLGSILGIVNPIVNRIVLGRVVGYRREDLLSAMRIPVTTVIEDPSTLQTPLVLGLDLVAEAEIGDNGLGEPQPPTTPIEPGSPVIVPKPFIVKKLLGIPGEGVLLGYLVTGSIVRRDIDVRIPLKTLYHHVLVIGTTGSGKTVLMKNLALSIHYEYKDLNPLVVAFDLQGDYLTLVEENSELDPSDRRYSPLERLAVILPVTKTFLEELKKSMDGSVGDVEGLAEELARRLAEEYVGKTYRGYNIVGVNPSLRRIDGEDVVLEAVDVVLEGGGRELSLTIVPWSLRYVDVRGQLGEFMPMFTDQARLFLPKLLEKARWSRLEKIVTNIGNVEAIASRDLQLHKSTTANILRGLLALNDTGLFDNYVEVDKTVGQGVYTRKPLVWIAEPDYRVLFELVASMLVVDLRWANMYATSPYTQTIIVYRVLERIFNWKDERLREGVSTRPTIILVDEAHNYFPQSMRENFSKDIVEATINKLTRLGRIRRIGVVFATHQPQDLNNLVIQLTNTKVAFRSDKRSLEAIGLGEYYEVLRNAPSGYTVTSSYAIRAQTITVQTLPPQTRHQKP